MNFISATTEYSISALEPVSAPYFRKKIFLDKMPKKSELIICGLGFYELFINGNRITKGALAPYISNPDDILYYDLYDLNKYIIAGENVIGVWLGNGFQNTSIHGSEFGHGWDFDKARWRAAPQVALRADFIFNDESILSIESDTSFLTTDSPVFYDDLRNGEYYDARLEIDNWSNTGFDDSSWKPAIKSQPARGETRLCQAEPIVATREITPISIKAQEGGFLYDFGINSAGICRLKIDGICGQEIILYHGEHLLYGKLNRRNIAFFENEYIQKDIYICKGKKDETYTPTFTYHGFQYVLVKGLTAEQATSDALTYIVMNSDLKERGGFFCSDQTVNKLQEATRVSTLANFYYFPTDCPQREKNGWTADAALSAEHTLLNLSAETSYLEWMRNIRHAQNEKGAIPGIIPTSGWGFVDYNGPAWDCVLVWLPYYTYIYRGDKAILQENAHAIFRYIEYLTTLIGEDGLICYGLGDWCPAGRNFDDYQAPLRFTDTVMGIDICEKSAYIFNELNMLEQKDFAMAVYRRLRSTAREKLIDFSTMTADGRCQTSQSMAIFFNIFDESEKAKAFDVLLEIIKEKNNHLDVGVLGGRVLFHVLAEYGYTDLALKMIIQPTFPSYGWWINQGATSLWEDFREDAVSSLNHHFWGDISHFFIRRITGIHYNPDCKGGKADIIPCFAESLEYAEGFHLSPEGEIRVRWSRENDGILLKIIFPETLAGVIKLPADYSFSDGKNEKPAESGEYILVKS